MPKKHSSLIPKTKNTPEQSQGKAFLEVHARSSILPPPDELRVYEDIIPGVGKALLESYIKQQDHRIKTESTVLNGAIKRTARAQWLAFFLALTAICGGIGLLFLGKNITGLAVLIGSAATLIGVFIYGKKLNTKTYNRHIDA